MEIAQTHEQVGYRLRRAGGPLLAGLFGAVEVGPTTGLSAPDWLQVTFPLRSA